MTLILSEASCRWALQVSDRLVTLAGNGTSTPFDPAANKSIVLQASNGVATLSYTGLSYVGHATTDSWIASRLVGPEMSFDPVLSGFAVRMATRRRPWRTMGALLRSLAKDLSRAFRNADPKHAPFVIVTGWLWYRKKRSRPFIAIVGLAGRTSYEVRWAPRLYARSFWFVPAPGGYVNDQERQDITERLCAISDAERASEEFVELIRTVAGRTTTVGHDCMAILIDHPDVEKPRIVVRYEPAAPARVIRTGNAEWTSTPAFSPWVIGRDRCIPPNLMIGGHLNFSLGHYQLHLQGPPLEGDDPIFTTGAQPRPPRP